MGIYHCQEGNEPGGLNPQPLARISGAEQIAGITVATCEDARSYSYTPASDQNVGVPGIFRNAKAKPESFD